ncbi:MAG: phospho-N-acetylmuramoyl-pentapeptide-transferase [Bacteroidaceae bacterium]|nr:phospho-N-acetylmuramoyl-pentapeptide-transferase [Bacteroidales bacterium]MBQ2878934.1 phospho-N-acetylmuramoyl-pentapeptide-transferase [Bacteroidaceae bacterium]MBQ3189128.1 phospho-N-acetylmuramoyl-pentapeptide-transferase [Bacteroidaceae bacterium]MBQ3622628.1 phospho-N-acetylmuramoyl-pentapeptide-transferase [Bacteroidaceae bacterium]
MLNYLFNILQQIDFPGARLFGYTSFRALTAVVLALLISTIFGEYFIRFFRKRQISETLRDMDKTNLKKGVPTMGGIIIIVAVVVPCLLLGRLDNIYMLLLIITTLWLGLVGFADDYIKTFKKNKEGLPGKFKVMAQVALGLIIGITLYLSPQAVMRENISVQVSKDHIEVQHRATPEKLNKTTIPFIKNHNFDYNAIFSFCGEYANAAGWIFFVIVTIFIVTAVSNGANLNDGMDGMLAGNAAIMGVTLAILAYVSSHVGWAEYLNIMFLPGSEEVVIFTFAFIGALIGFLWYNSFPAQVFMGDTGSLTIGGIIAVTAILLHKEILLVLICGIFVAENLSVILQTAYFKQGKKKGVRQRLFRCAPLHHHYSITDDKLDSTSKYLFKGPKTPMHESKITFRFWIVTIIMAAITLMTLKIR